VLGEERVAAVLRDYRTAPVPPRVRAALVFLERLALVPDDIDEADLAALRLAGLSDDAIEDAAFVCALFSTYVRLADTFRVDVPPAAGFAASARSLLSHGYAFPPPIAWLMRLSKS
jgi:alkylhydroperoxidase family enzyme